jgi:hypothetical protein
MEPKSISDMPCEVCGKPSVVWIRDILRREDDPSSNWAKFEPDGPPHFFCAEHRRASTTTVVGMSFFPRVHR